MTERPLYSFGRSIGLTENDGEAYLAYRNRVVDHIVKKGVAKGIAGKALQAIDEGGEGHDIAYRIVRAHLQGEPSLASPIFDRPESTDPREAWQLRGQCRGHDPDLFVNYYSESSTAGRAVVALAKEVCGRCDVVEQCRQAAIEGQEDGVWGGTTRKEREELSRKRPLA